jgi:hypothetical protein
VLRQPPEKKKPDAVGTRIGLGNMGISFHDFFSIPMLLNSSELMFETSRSALAKATNRSKQTITTATNMVFSFL